MLPITGEVVRQAAHVVLAVVWVGAHLMLVWLRPVALAESDRLWDVTES